MRILVRKYTEEVSVEPKADLLNHVVALVATHGAENVTVLDDDGVRHPSSEFLPPPPVEAQEPASEPVAPIEPDPPAAAEPDPTAPIAPDSEPEKKRK